MAKLGRPRQISDEQIQSLLTQYADGVPLKHACVAANVPYMTVMDRCVRDKDLSVFYERCREAYGATKVASMYEIAQSEPEVPRARLLCDVIKWEMSKVLPKTYGDKIQAVDADGNQLSIVINKLV
jgi:hypothetical protein